MRSYGYPEGRTAVVRNGVDVRHFADPHVDGSGTRAQFDALGAVPLFVCAARLSPEKGIDLLIAAVGILRADGLRAKCVVVGDGPLRDELTKLAARAGLSDDVHFVGFQSDVRPYYRSANAVVLPSHVEGLPYVLVEAMCASVPCIATRVGGVSEIISDGVDGLVVEPGSAPALAAAMKRLAGDPALRRAMGTEAGAKARTEFDRGPAMLAIRRVLLKPRHRTMGEAPIGDATPSRLSSPVDRGP